MDEYIKNLELINEEHKKINGDLRNELKEVIKENEQLKADYGSEAQVERDILRIQISAREEEYLKLQKKVDKVLYKLLNYTNLTRCREELINDLKGNDYE